MRQIRLLMVLSVVAFMLGISFATASGDTGSWSAASPMAYERFHHKSVLLNDGRVLVVGGHYKDANFSGPAEIYDPKTDSWSNAGWPQPWGEDHKITLLQNGKVLVVGGFPPELYDPATNSWTSAGTMMSVRRFPMATMLSNGKVLVVGGHIGTVTSSAELYDPDTNSWSPAASMTGARWSGAAILLKNGKVLVTGGAGGPMAELYDADTDTWSPGGFMAVDRSFHTLTMLADGKVLAAGGYHAGSGEVYDPATNTWSNQSVMPLPVYSHTATLLGNGTVLVAGGRTENNVLPSADAWLYDPATNSWSHDSSMSTPRVDHTAVLLQDGKVLVAGGQIDGEYWGYKATLAATAEIRSQITYTISGAVRQTNASQVKGATVSIGDKTTTTDSTGAFSISGIPAGTYTLTVSKAGYLTRTVSGFVVSGDVTAADYYLLRPKGPLSHEVYSVSGTVRQGNGGGQALPGATISVAGKKATSAPDGTFSISGLSAGTYMLTVSKPGYVTKTVSGFAVKNDLSDLLFFLTPAASRR